jgi:hypothetical protein
MDDLLLKKNIRTIWQGSLEGFSPLKPNKILHRFKWRADKNHFSIYTGSYELKNLLHLALHYLWLRSEENQLSSAPNLAPFYESTGITPSENQEAKLTK